MIIWHVLNAISMTSGRAVQHDGCIERSMEYSTSYLKSMHRVSYRGGALTGHQACAEMKAMITQTKRHEAMHDQRGYVGRLTCNASIKT